MFCNPNLTGVLLRLHLHSKHPSLSWPVHLLQQLSPILSCFRAALLQKKANTLTIFDDPETRDVYVNAYTQVFTVSSLALC